VPGVRVGRAARFIYTVSRWRSFLYPAILVENGIYLVVAGDDRRRCFGRRPLPEKTVGLGQDWERGYL